MHLEEIFNRTLKSLPNANWLSSNNGHNIAFMAGVSKCLNYLGEQNNVVVFNQLNKMPLIKLGDDYYSPYGKISDDFFTDYGMNKISHDAFI